MYVPGCIGAISGSALLLAVSRARSPYVFGAMFGTMGSDPSGIANGLG